MYAITVNAWVVKRKPKLTSTIERWLGELDLDKYSSTFVEAEIDLFSLPLLTDEDLRELGLPLGPRRKVLHAASQIESSESSTHPHASTDNRHIDTPYSAERRHLTIMFVDLVGSTAMSTKLDAEELREIITNYQNNVAGVIARYRGFIARFMGDGVLIYFGWPEAGEEDAERAVRAGMAIITSVTRITGPDNQPLSCRIGIASGVVVVGDLIGTGTSEETAVVGETPNLAARLQGVAEPDQLVISQETRNLTSNVFELQSLGMQHLKGIEQSAQAFAVTGTSATKSRFDSQKADLVAPVYGRDHEIQMLGEIWSRVKSGAGHLVLVTGEAGIGKSRVTHAIADQISKEDSKQITWQCSPYHSESAFHPIISWLTYQADIHAEDDDEIRLQKLAHTTDLCTEELDLIATMMDIDTSKNPTSPKLNPAKLRADTMRSICQLVIGFSKPRPVLLLFEDLHWIDPTSLELLVTLLAEIEQEKVFILATARPEFEHNFANHSIVSRMEISRLNQNEVYAIVNQLSDGKKIPDELMKIIAERTDGVPLFVEELTKTIFETGVLKEEGDHFTLTSPLVSSTIPNTLHDSLMARLDRQQSLKSVAQTAACLGREFSYKVLEQITSTTEGELKETLNGLIEAELIYQSGALPWAQFTFKHALVRDAAYESLLKENRRSVHLRILDVLSNVSDTPPELLAWHAEGAGQIKRAIDLWQTASKIAINRPAFGEAVSHLNRAIALVSPQLTQNNNAAQVPNALQLALELQIKLGQARYIANGYGDNRTRVAFERALVLAKEAGDIKLHVSALHGIWVGHHVFSKHTEALTLAEEMLELVSANEDTAQSILANRLIGTSLYSLGRFAEAQHKLSTANANYCPHKNRDSAQQSGIDQGVVNSCNLAGNLWALGQTQNADDYVDKAEKAAMATGHVNTITYLHSYLAGFMRSAARYTVSKEHTLALHSLSIEHGITFYQERAQHQLAAIEAQQGDVTAVARFLKADAHCEKLIHLAVPTIRIETGFFALDMKLLEEAQLLAKMARDLIEQTSEKVSLSNLHRLEGALALENRQLELAEHSLKSALLVAQEQQSKIWELRAAIDLARLWQSMHRNDESYSLIQSVLECIADGDCAEDVKTARALISRTA